MNKISIAQDNKKCNYCQNKAAYEMKVDYCNFDKDYYCENCKKNYIYEVERNESRISTKLMYDIEIKKYLRPDGTMKTPREECPELEKDSLGWRMGYGESYKMIYDEWEKRKLGCKLVY